MRPQSWLILIAMVTVSGAFALLYDAPSNQDAPDITSNTAATTRATERDTTEVQYHDDRIEVFLTPASTLDVTDSTPADSDGPYSSWAYSEPVQVPDDTTITGFATEMVNADYHTLHHVSVGIQGQPSALCTEAFADHPNAQKQLYAASRNTPQPVHLPDSYGIPVESDESLLVTFMAHPQGAPHGPHDAGTEIDPTLKVTLYTDANRTKKTDFARLRLDDTPCERPKPHQAFAVPAGDAPYTKTADPDGSATFTFTQPGKILLGGANFWPRKGGESVTAYLNTEPIDTATATAGADPWEWSIAHKSLDQSVAAGDTMTISSTYQNPFSTPVQDASGMYGIYYTYDEPI